MITEPRHSVNDFSNVNLIEHWAPPYYPLAAIAAALGLTSCSLGHVQCQLSIYASIVSLGREAAAGLRDYIVVVHHRLPKS